MRTNFILGILFLLAQLLSIIYARFIPERYFCWAPYDEHTLVETTVWVDGMKLSPDQANKRYRYLVNGWEPRSVHNVFDIIEHYESTRGREQNVRVEVVYATNGRDKKLWAYTNPMAK